VRGAWFFIARLIGKGYKGKISVVVLEIEVHVPTVRQAFVLGQLDFRTL